MSSLGIKDTVLAKMLILTVSAGYIGVLFNNHFPEAVSVFKIFFL